MDILSIWHFIFFFVLAYFIKDNFLLITIIGVSWEIFEYYITNIPLTRDLLIKWWPIPIKYWEEKIITTKTGFINPWFIENIPLRIEDLIFNTLGYTSGLIFFKYFS